MNTVLALIEPMLAQAPDAEALGVSSILDFVRKGGIMMVPIALCSLVTVAVVLERTAVLRRSRVIPRSFMAGFAELMDRGRSARSDVLEYLAAHDSPAARILAAGVDKLGHRTEIVEKHMGAAGEQEIYLLRTRLRALVVVTAVAPLLGLTGTILGMIKSFQTVALSGEALGKAELLANGIYEAMITTAAGLIVAMPTLVLYHWLAGKVERLTRDLDRMSMWFVEQHVLAPLEEDTLDELAGVPEDQTDGFAASPVQAGGIGGGR